MTNMFHFGLLRVDPIYREFRARKIRVGWKCWFQNGAHYAWLDDTGWPQVWGPVAPQERELRDEAAA
jgi:hypothetical protein